MDDVAVVAGRLSTHEAVCAERWGEIKTSVRGLWWVVLACAGVIITGQAGLIVTLTLAVKH